LLRALAVVSLVGLADSLNPSTVAPAVYFAMSSSPARRVLELTAGVFAVSLAGGVLLVLGPGQWLRDALPHPGPHLRHLLLLGAGALLIGGASVLWALRPRLARKGLPGSRGGGGSAFATGATVMAAELPTAFPYFGAIAVIIGSSTSLPVRLGLVALYNVLFVAPLVAIAVVLVVAPSVRRSLVEPAAVWLGRHWPKVLAGLTLVLGLGLAAAGVAGLTREG